MTTRDNTITYKYLLGIVAEELGISETEAATGMPVAPTGSDEQDLIDRAHVVRLVDKGIRSLVTSHPWKWLVRDMTLVLDPDGAGPANIASDAARYRLPHWFNGTYRGSWTFTQPTAPERTVPILPYSQVQEFRSGDPSTACDPRVCGIRKNSPTDKTTVPEIYTGWEAIFYPTPSRALELVIEVDAWPYGMSRDEDQFVAGPFFDEALEACCLYEAAMSDRNSDSLDMRRMRRDEALVKAIRMDQRSGPRRTRLERVNSLDEYDAEGTHSVGTITIQGRVLRPN